MSQPARVECLLTSWKGSVVYVYMYTSPHNYLLCLYLQAEDALSSNDTEVVLEVVGELVQATAADDAPQLPQDLDTTNEIISDTLDLLFNDLDTAIAQNDTNVTAVDVRQFNHDFITL